MIINKKDKESPRLKFNFPFRAEKVELLKPPPSSSSSPTYMTRNGTGTGIQRPASNPTTPTTPTVPKHDYNDPTVYYVCRDFFAASDEHLSVFVDDELEVIEELPGGTWTRVRERDSKQVGMIPTEILESGSERLAKENKTSNQDTIRFMSCKANESGPNRRKNKRKSVSFCEVQPEIIQYPPDDTNDHSIFPFTLDEDLSEAIANTEAYPDDYKDTDSCTLESTFEPKKETETEKGQGKGKGFFKKIFTKKSGSVLGSGSSLKSNQILATLKSFEQYQDHLIRVYTGNFDPVLHAYKTFIVDESLTFAEFTHMALCTFQLEMDQFNYEINLVNHLTAEIVALDTDFTIEQVIEITKREGLAFENQMPKELRKAQKSALKRLLKRKNDQLVSRDKSTDYVTPFKFVLNRIYVPVESVPVYVHVSLAYTCGPDQQNNSTNLLISSLFSENQPDRTGDVTVEKKKKWFKTILSKKKEESPVSFSSSNHLKQQVHRILTMTHDPLHTLIHHLLESLQVPSTLPGIAFEAFLPAIHDAIELPLPMNMPVGDVLRIRPKLDPAEQVIIIRPIIIEQ